MEYTKSEIMYTTQQCKVGNYYSLQYELNIPSTTSHNSFCPPTLHTPSSSRKTHLNASSPIYQSASFLPINRSFFPLPLETLHNDNNSTP